MVRDGTSVPAVSTTDDAATVQPEENVLAFGGGIVMNANTTNSGNAILSWRTPRSPLDVALTVGDKIVLSIELESNTCAFWGIVSLMVNVT